MTNSLKVIALREIKILKSLSQSEIEMIAEAAIFQKIPKNKTIYDIRY